MPVLLLLLAANVAAASPPSWLTYRDPELGFSVDLPGDPVRTRSSQLTPAGRVRSDVMVAFLGGTEFRIEVHEIPLLARWLVSEEGLLERAAADLLHDEGAASAQQTPERFGEHAGRRVVYTDRGGRPGEGWFVLAGGRLFLMAVLWPLDDAARPGRARFFDSFALVPNASAS